MSGLCRVLASRYFHTELPLSQGPRQNLSCTCTVCQELTALCSQHDYPHFTDGDLSAAGLSDLLQVRANKSCRTDLNLEQAVSCDAAFPLV